jgi:tRNA nucleotidyltransferase (CCA-adding enzyme)
VEIITSHINADFDALASMLAAKKLFPEAKIVFPGSQEKKVREFLEAFPLVGISRLKDIDLDKIKTIIIVDTKNAKRIGEFAKLISNPIVEIQIFDHHPKAKDDIHGSKEVIENVGATATLFTEILKSKGIHLSPIEATLLCLGIYEETGFLMFPSTTEKDLLAAAYLVKHGANLNIVSSYLRLELSREELELLNELVQSSKETIVSGIRIKTAKAAHLAHRIMDMESIDAVFLLLGMEGKTIIVARSRGPELNVADVMKEFGGGGHPTAASATIKDMPIEIIEEKLGETISKNVRPEKVAGDIMTSPVITINWDVTIRTAEKIMTKYEVNVLPVMKSFKYAGLLSREIVEKALFHRLGKNKAIDFCTIDAASANPHTSIREIEHTMIEQNQRFMPVLENDKIVGAITRTDLLRTLYEEFLRRSHIEKFELKFKPSIGRNISVSMKDRFPSEMYSILLMAGKVGDEFAANVYLVGGSVRDLLRGEQNLDIDIVVEGDGIEFAKSLAKQLKAKVRIHERFRTAKIITEHFALDVATARTEYYESPASLPKVEMSSIKKDIYRRDFTINTLAVKLNSKDFGTLTDFFGGQRDLKEKTIRVLHNLSFVEDPTRAFRAVRFAERFDFRLSKHTENMIRLAVKMNVIGMLSGERLFEELQYIFNETEPLKTFKRLSDLGLLKVICPELVLHHELESVLQSTSETLAWFNLLFLKEKPDKTCLYLMALFSGLKNDERKKVVKRLSLQHRMGETIVKGTLQSKELLRKLPIDSPIELYHLLKGISLEILLFSMALCRDKQKQKSISHYLIELRKIKQILTGDDLKKVGVPPGPAYAVLFEKLLDEKLKGRMKTKEEEISFVKKTIFKTKKPKNIFKKKKLKA